MTAQTFTCSICKTDLDVEIQVSWISKAHGGKRIFKNKCKPCQSDEKNAWLKKQRQLKSKYWKRKLLRDKKYYAINRITINTKNNERYRKRKVKQLPILAIRDF